MEVDFTVIGGAEPWSLYSRWPQNLPSRRPPCTPKLALAPSAAMIQPPPVTKSSQAAQLSLAAGASESRRIANLRGQGCPGCKSRRERIHGQQKAGLALGRAEG